MADLSHAELCERAAKWLRGVRRCDPVLTRVASCSEVPDAIGWSSHHRWHGSTVVECKVSLADFRRDRKKGLEYEHPANGFRWSAKRISKREAAKNGYRTIEIPRMGDFRFYLCPSGLISVDVVQETAPGAGLLYADGGRVKVMMDATRQTGDAGAEVRYLRFSLIHLRDNLMKCGVGVDLEEATKFFGQKGITLPASGSAGPPERS